MKNLQRSLLVILASTLFVSTLFAQVQEKGKFVLYKYQKAMGTEVYEISTSKTVLELNSRFELSFIGSSFDLNTVLRLDKDSLSPRYFETKGATSTRTRVDTTVVYSGNEAVIREGQSSTKIKTGRPSFAVLQPAPIAPQMMLFRFWKKQKPKGKIDLLPGRTARITPLGTDTISVRGVNQELYRFSISGVMWGDEIVWFDKDDNLIALVGADAEMDRFEAVREGYEEHLKYFVRAAASDSVDALKRLSEEIPIINDGEFAVVGGLLIGGKDFAIIPDSVIIVRNGMIAEAGPASKVKVPKGLKVFDATGKTILPGLFDMHAHATQWEWFPASLAAGITTMRDAANELEFIVPLRDGVRSGGITVSPRLLLAGFIDSGPSSVGNMKAETPEEAKEIVRLYSRNGFEQIKIYQSLRPELVKVVADEAHKLGMTVTGHIPTGMNIWQAVDAGYDQVNHLGFIYPIMTRRGFDPDAGEKRNFDPTTAEAKAGFEFLRKNGIVVEPTLARGENSSKVFGDSYVSTEPGMAMAPPAFAELIKSMGVSAEDSARRRQSTERRLKVLKELHAAGVPIIAGTDLVVPGHTIYRELELFVMAGLTPIDAIKSTTIVPARAMKLDSKLGTVEAGKIADLVVIDGNPLRSIVEIRNVSNVMKDGKLFQSSMLWESVGFEPWKTNFRE